MDGRVEGKVAFVTGAARGQGRSHAVRLAEEGADIIAVDVCKKVTDDSQIPASTPDDLAETADLVKGLNRRIVTAEVDVRDYDALKTVVDGGVEQLGRLDIIVANAGIGNGGQTLDKTSETDWNDMIDINLSGVWKSVKAAVPHLISGGHGGSIILTSSVGGLKPYPHTGHYIAAKHGVIGLMRTFAVELGQHSIRVNAVCPTNVNTPMFMNEGTKKLFRPDLENPGVDDLAVGGTIHARAADRLGRTHRHQQRRAVPGLRRVPLRHWPSRHCRRREHAQVGQVLTATRHRSLRPNRGSARRGDSCTTPRSVQATRTEPRP